LLSELAELLQLPEDDLLVLTFWAAKVLGLPFDTALPESCFVCIVNTLEGHNDVLTWSGMYVEKRLAKSGDMLHEKQVILISNRIEHNKRMAVRATRSQSAGYLHKILLKKDDPMELGQAGALILPFPPAYAVWREAVGIPAVAP
jgi:hypothetical protein